MVQKSNDHQLRLVVEIYHYLRQVLAPSKRWLFGISEASICMSQSPKGLTLYYIKGSSNPLKCSNKIEIIDPIISNKIEIIDPNKLKQDWNNWSK